MLILLWNELHAGLDWKNIFYAGHRWFETFKAVMTPQSAKCWNIDKSTLWHRGYRDDMSLLEGGCNCPRPANLRRVCFKVIVHQKWNFVIILKLESFIVIYCNGKKVGRTFFRTRPFVLWNSIQIWKDMRVNKWCLNIYFRVNYLFKAVCKCSLFIWFQISSVVHYDYPKWPQLCNPAEHLKSLRCYTSDCCVTNETPQVSCEEMTYVKTFLSGRFLQD